MLNVNKKVVAVVLEVEPNAPEYFKATKIANSDFYAVEMDGLIIVSTLMPSNKYRGYFQQLSELFALKDNVEVREQLARPDLTASELMSLLDRYQEAL
ncbi:hypothetical protein AB685_00410 [Bacillus sp. LL01]|uniref:hypothetical protein n=1 Tax=Bacillus sp. LL01 TaxID=1665556 RepID=UPI00064CE614|nr:hypothetical protein [Bacillus sp. LL01]KMJ59389.1 hypothetical protein AB685_00410 [Bacillus sp. LL01]